MESTVRVSAISPGRRSAPARASRLLVSPPSSGAMNMAMDEALLRRAGRTGEPVYRVYSWASPTVSLGRNQPARGAYDLRRARTLGIDFVRRPTGGRAILHHREITYSVAAPIADFGSLRESYRAINRLLLEALRALGVDAKEADSSSRAPIPGLAPCFDAPVSGELVADGRKLVGSAQVREGEAFLQHGSILVDDDQQLLADLVGRPQPVPAPATLRGLIGREVTVQEFAGALQRVMRSSGGSVLESLEPETSLLDEIQLLVHSRYAVADWTWRR